MNWFLNRKVGSSKIERNLWQKINQNQVHSNRTGHLTKWTNHMPKKSSNMPMKSRNKLCLLLFGCSKGHLRWRHHSDKHLTSTQTYNTKLKYQSWGLTIPNPKKSANFLTVISRNISIQMLNNCIWIYKHNECFFLLMLQIWGSSLLVKKLYMKEEFSTNIFLFS